MDRKDDRLMVELSEELYQRIHGLLKTLVASCKQCASNNKSKCLECDLNVVPYLVGRLDARKNDLMSRLNRVDHVKRFKAIEDEIRAAGRPLRSMEIDRQKKLCARGLKYWSLHKMVKIGILNTIRINGKTHFALNEKKENA